MKLLTWIIGVPVAVGATVFAVVNRQTVPVDLWPLPWDISMPLFALVLGALGLGLVLGAMIAWVSSLRVYGRARRERRRAHKLEAEVQSLREGHPQVEDPSKVEHRARAAKRKSLPGG